LNGDQDGSEMRDLVPSSWRLWDLISEDRASDVMVINN
jgi:hypothetical protein